MRAATTVWLALMCAAVPACRTDVLTSTQPTGAAASGADWSLGISALIPAIRTCANDGAEPAETVLKAWRLRGDRVGVRIRDATGQRHDCVAARSGGFIDSFIEPKDTDVLPDEGRPIFYPASRNQPFCSGLRPVRVNGVVEGWLRPMRCS